MKNAGKKILTAMLAAMILTEGAVSVSMFLKETPVSLTVHAAEQAEITESGKCGEDVSYTLDSNGVLHITGTGDMFDYVCEPEGDLEPDLGNYDDFFSDWGVRHRHESDSDVSESSDNLNPDPAIPGSNDDNNDNPNPDPEIPVDDPQTQRDYYYSYESPFYYHEGVKSVVIDEGITSIGGGLFRGCKNLTSVTIPKSVVRIGWDTFYNCENLTNITIPESVVEIGGGAFGGTGLTDCIIPDSVTKIGYFAFSDCDNITLYGSKGSCAEQYANEYDIPFEVIEKNLKNTASISAEDILIGEKITLTGSAEGGKGNYTYAYYYKKTTDKKWVTAKGFSGTTSVSIKPNMAKDYDICIKVKDADGKIEKKYFTVTVHAKLACKASVSAEDIKLGERVTLKGGASGGMGAYTYAYYYKKTTDRNWVTAKTFSSSSSVSIKPAMAKDYDICIKVKDATGTIQKKYFTVTVTK